VEKAFRRKLRKERLQEGSTVFYEKKRDRTKKGAAGDKKMQILPKLKGRGRNQEDEEMYLGSSSPKPPQDKKPSCRP